MHVTRTIWIYCTLFRAITITYLFSSFPGSEVRFVNLPKDLKIGVRDTNVLINWDYHLQDPDILTSITFGYYNKDDTQFIIAAKQKNALLSYNPELKKQDKANILVDANDVSIARITLKVIILDYENNRKYFCRIRTTKKTILSNVIVNVYGKKRYWQLIYQSLSIVNLFCILRP